jgi:glycosyltransferase involved in cell wall biosynthesis
VDDWSVKQCAGFRRSIVMAGRCACYRGHLAAARGGQAAAVVRIAIDASRTTAQRATGTEHYATRLIQTLTHQNKQHQLTLYFRDAPPAALFSQSAFATQRVIPFRRAWTHLRFAAELWRDQPDVTFVPAHTLPALFPGAGVVTVHDLGFKYFPQAHPVSQRIYLDWSTRYSARRASIVLADSQATAQDLTRFYGTSSEKIRVVYPGVDKPVVGDVQVVRRKYQLPERYFLFIGTLQPRKNIPRIVQAYAHWWSGHQSDGVGLVLAGEKGWLYDEAWVEGIPNVHLPGYIDNTDKGALYAGALALVFPSLYEGFGFPVIEAMHSGTPVITSSTSSLPELAGDAAILVNPAETYMIADALEDIASNEGTRQSLREKGYAQAARFTWERAAEQVMASLESVGEATIPNPLNLDS